MTVTMPHSNENQSPDALERCLKERFGLASFRQDQRGIIETAMDGQSALVVMPTGAGKSLCYQLPAMLLEGVTLVVSPLIALMKDQVDALDELGLPATFVNSTLDLSEQNRRLRRVAENKIKLLFVAPERFRNDMFWSALKTVEVSLLAVDEAHCISQWGHDFRPDYLALGDVRERLSHPLTLALTATATPAVQQDITTQLRIPNARVFVSGFERPNLVLECYRASGKADKLMRLQQHFGAAGSTPAIVYCSTRKSVEQVAEELAMNGPSVGKYHAGIPDRHREAAHDDFMDGELDILVATNAFGMGVDKPDIRSVVHFQIPSSLEAYYQEAGRAGRDGEAAQCLLLYNYADRRIPDFFIENNYPERGTIIEVWDAVHQLTGEVSTPPLQSDVAMVVPPGIHGFAVDSALKLLERAGHLRIDRSRQATHIVALDQASHSEIRVDWEALARRRAFEEERLKQMIFYATGSRCRTQDILRYFGSRSHHINSCDHCDNCIGGQKPAPNSRNRSPQRRKSRSSKTSRKITSFDSVTVICRKITACIARCGQTETPRTVAQVLAGSKATSLKKRELHRQSTYGILSHMTRADVEAIIDILVNLGFLEIRGRSLRLSQQAVVVMKGDDELPAPIRTALERIIRPAVAGLSSKRTNHSGDLTPTVRATLALLRQGNDLDEISSIRSLQRKTVIEHIISATRSGAANDIDLSDHVDDLLLNIVEKVAEEIGWEKSLKAFRDAVMKFYPGPKPSYDRIRLHIACLYQKRGVD